MENLIKISENGLNVVIEVAEDGDVRLLHFSSLPFIEESVLENTKNKYRLVELHVSGENQCEHHGHKHRGSNPGNRLKYKSHTLSDNNVGKKLEVFLEDNGLVVTYNMQFFNGIPTVKCWSELKNEGTEARGIEYITSFALVGIDKEGILPWSKKSVLNVPHNNWVGECQWRRNTVEELGFDQIGALTVKVLQYSNTGTWSTSKYLPMGCYENTEAGTSLFWQIENNGSWHWEIGDAARHLYLFLSGPTENENHWWKNLKPGDCFTTVPVAVGAVTGSFETAMQQLTRYRRAIRRPNKDNENLGVIFNDFMNCLNGDPTTEKLLPLIDAAAEVGCEYFCVDCGWYADGSWWDGVGEWLPSQVRFPGGIKEPLDHIRSKGMIPGLWLELEVMGIKCRLANELPDNWFFVKHGRRVIDNGRFQLDYRNPEVRKFASGVIDRLVNDYGVGYIKMDYNINAGIGTELDSDSFGDGLLQHSRAYLQWIDETFAKYPDLVIENCGSGGMRMDYALLSRHSIQSSSDQTDYKKYAAISASVPTAVTPEQCAVWSYPLRDGDKEEVIFNMVNAMLMRIHQSGHLAEISRERFNLVKEGIDYYKTMRADIKEGLPFWPLGIPDFSSQWVALGVNNGTKSYLAVWRRNASSDSCQLPIGFLEGKNIELKCAYPKEHDCKFYWHESNGELTIVFPNIYTARLFEITEK